MAIRDDIQPEELQLDEDLLVLWKQLQLLHLKLRDYTKRKYNRVNPFFEDLFEWKEKGRFFGGNNITIYESTIIHGDVKIGDNTWIGPFCSIEGSGGLTIGHSCQIGPRTFIATHDSVKSALSDGKEPFEYSPVSIGNNTFIGGTSVILRGVTIGHHCLIGASSMVNRDIPDFSIAAGTPAKVIGRVEFENGKVKLNYKFKEGS